MADNLTADINLRVEKAVNFLTRYFCNTSGYAYIWLKNKQTGDAQTLCFNVESQAEISAVVKRAMQLNTVEFYHVYFGVNVGSKPCNESSRHKKEDIHEQIAIVTDIDIKNAAHHKGDAENYPADSDTAISFLPVKPTILIDSGGGIHAYYKFEPPLEIANTDEGDAATLRGKKFLDVIRDKAGTYSKAIDGVHDLPRVLRLPYSFNCKDRNNLKLCTVIYETENYFTPAQIDEIISAAYFNPAENAADPKENFSPPPIDNFMDENLITTKEAAEIISKISGFIVSAKTVAKWRYRKLFGVPFFTADVKKNGAWYYLRERVEQLASVYQKGILQNMYKLARKFEGEKVCPFDIWETRRSIAKVEPKFFPADEVAQILGVVESTLFEWREDGTFVEDLQDHDGTYWYSAARVYEKKGGYADPQDPPEYELARRLEMLRVIDPAALSDTDWLAVNSAAKNEGLENYIDEWNRRDSARYNEMENKKRLDSLKDTSFDIATLHGIAKRFGYDEGDFKRQWYRDNPQFSNRKSSIHNDNAPADENVIAKIFGDNRNFILPYGYHMTRDSLAVEVEVKGKTQLKKFAELPFYISNYYRRRNGNYCVDVTTLSSNGRPATVKQIPKSELSDARKIAPLGDTELPFNSNNARYVIDYVQKFLAANSQILKVADLHDKLGWAEIDDKDIFISPYSDKFVIDKNNTLIEHLRVKGDYQNWLAIVRKVFEQSPIGRIIFSAALASLLLNVIGCRVFVVYLRCKSKAGKSAVFKLAASIFGDNEILKSFNATINSLEGVIADISPFPAIFDERQVASANFDVNNFVYRAGEGQGRGRCKQDGTQRATKRWKNITICNGEERLTESARTQGLHTRTLELNFTGDKILPDDLAQDIHIMFDTQKVFGYGGKIFLEKLQSENLDAMPDDYKSICKVLKEKYPAYVDDHNRFIAAITFANFLARKYFFDVTDADAFNAAMDDAEEIFPLIDTQINLSDEEMEKEFLLGWIAENRLHFEGMTNSTDGEKLVTPIFGKAEDDYIFINTKSLKEALKRAGLSYSKVKDDMFAAGVFVKVDGQDSIQKKVSGVNFRCIKLLR